MTNKAILVGRVGQEPEIRAVGENKVAKFSLATSRKYKAKSGESKEDTQWHNIELWGGLANVVETYVHKGNLLYIEGEIQYREHEGKYYTTIRANNMQMLGSKGEKPSDAPETEQQSGDLPF